MWSQLVAAAQDPNRGYELHTILNPASGPGTALDPNFINSSGVGPLASLNTANSFVHGYVATTYGARNINDVKADIAQYFGTGLYGGHTNGIFLDEMSNDLKDVSYYQELTAYAKSLDSNAIVFGNPGTIFVTNTTNVTGVTALDFAKSVDVVMSFEQSAAQYATNYTAPPYAAGVLPNNIAHVIHTQATWDPNLLQTASSRGAGFLFCHRRCSRQPL
jgi:hypothetical protein